MADGQELSVVNRYVLRDSLRFEAAVTALAARVRDEGHPGILSYRFYRPGPDEGRAVVTYADPAAWVGHHDLVMGWPEMVALRAAADLAEIMLFGPVSPAMQDWLDRMGVSGLVRHQGLPVAGFRRG
jgi:quinol monooxygenase YgiN